MTPPREDRRLVYHVWLTDFVNGRTPVAACGKKRPRGRVVKLVTKDSSLVDCKACLRWLKGRE